MFNPFERMMAFRYLRARKAEGFVSVIAGFSFAGIMLGVATLIIVMAVMNGFRQELFTKLLGLNGHINVMVSEQGLPVDYLALAETIRQVQGVEAVTPMIESQALLTSGGASSGVMVRGLAPEDFVNRPILADSVQDGSVYNLSENTVAIGVTMARNLRLSVGDVLVLLSPKGRAGPFGTVPRSATFEVGMIFDVGMHEYNSNFIFMNLATAQRFFQIQGVTALEVMLPDMRHLDRTRAAIEGEVGAQGRVYDWRDLNQSFFNALQVERNVMFLILTLIILVAAFNIISSMIMLVKDKGRDIAILRTMGAPRSSMMKIFMLTGASIGVAGTFVGSVLGIAFAMNIETVRRWIESLTGTDLFAAEIYFLSRLPAEIDWSEVGIVILMALVLSVLATLYPAWRAAQLDPVEALRYE